MLQYAVLNAPPHRHCGGEFGRVSRMTADTDLADHARDCVQPLVKVHSGGAKEVIGPSLSLSRGFLARDAAVKVQATLEPSGYRILGLQ